ncbi:uncharacterized protein LOC126549237 [Aphis gossypii]|uniref:uncharacterized protein LOC126549237 n=1 Tax=Aphis gossypii TaxID=80765 RepID=UPI00215991B3|nr:uncharacterized protein LOC126549237 [Aphis gossypii]XP_050053811.1 uncharacterized protein LOC126549237 [Aphis gossypii]
MFLLKIYKWIVKSIRSIGRDSDPQMPAVESEQAGSLQSLFSEWQNNGSDDWQKNVTMKAELQAVQSAIKMLELQLVAQDGGLKLLFQRVEHFELSAKEMHSPTVSTAISELLEVVGALRDSRECVNKAFNELTELTKDLATMATSDQTASESLQTPATRISTVDSCTNTPRWWEEPANQQIADIVPEASSEQGTSKENQQENRGNRGQQAQQQQVASNSKSAEKSVPELDLEIKESWYTMVQNEEAKNSGKAVVETANQVPPEDTHNSNRGCLPKTQTVVPDNLSCMSTYADMVEDIKDHIRDEELDFDITTEWSKSGDHLVLTTSEKDNAIKLSKALRNKVGEEKSIRRPSSSISLLLIGIEDSVDVDELKSTLDSLDKELIAANKLTIKKGLNGVRTVIVKVPRAPGLRLVQAKKIKVGRAICRVKELVTRQRCAKCCAPDHAIADCTGQETRKCFRCKKTGHLIAACDLPHSSSTAFQSNENLGAEEQRKKTPTE